MSEPRLQRNARTGEYRVSMDGGATWQPARVQANKSTGERRFSVDGGSAWQPLAAESRGGEDQTVEGGTAAALERLPANPAEWDVNDARDAERILSSGNATGKEQWLRDAVDAWKNGGKIPKREPSAAAPASAPAPAAPQQAPAEQPQDIGVGGHLKAAGKGIWSALASNPRAVAAATPVGSAILGATDVLRSDAARGAGQGFSFSRGDEAAANVAEIASVEAPGDASPRSTSMNASNRVASRGLHAPAMSPQQVTDAVYEDLRDNERQANAVAEERSPWLYGGGRVASMAPAAVASAPAFGVAGAGSAGAGLGTMALRSAAQGGALGATDASGRDVDASGGERLQDTALGGGAGALGGAAGVYGGAGAGWGAAKIKEAPGAAWRALANSSAGQKTADWARGAANSFRNDAVGGFGGRAQQVAQKEGVEFIEGDFAEGVERLLPAERGMFGLPKARTAADYAKQAAAAQEQLGAQYGKAIDDMTEQGVSAPLRGQADDPGVLDAALKEIRRLKALKGKTDDEKTKLAALQRATEDIAKAHKPDERLSARDMESIRKRWGDSGFAPKMLEGTPRAVRKAANRDVSNSALGALRGSADNMAMPETATAYREAARDLPIAKMARELGDRARVRDAGGPGSLTLTQWGREAVRDNYGADTAANALRGLEMSLRPQHGPMPASALPKLGAEAGGMQGRYWGALAGDARPNMTPAYAAPTQDDPVAASVEEEKRLTERNR